MQIRRAYRLLLPLLAVLASASCQKHEAQEPSTCARVPILFNCNPVSVTTKAGDTYVSNSSLQLHENDYFYVYAWNTGASYLSAAPGVPSFFNPALKVQFVRNDNQGSYNTYNTATLREPLDQYWPQGATPYDYSFIAYYPYHESSSTYGISTPDFSTPPAGNVAMIPFVAKTDAPGDPAVNKMVDFCVSDIANDQVYGHTTSPDPGTVDLTFRHMLTLVQIKFVKSRDVSSDTVIELLDAKLENINTEGDLTVAYTPPVSPGQDVMGTTSFHWINVDTPESYEITVNGVDPSYDSGTGIATDPITLGYTQTVATGDIFLMIPQYLWPYGHANRQRIHFWWRVDGGEVQETDDTYLSESKKAIGSDDSSGIAEWRINQMVTYTVVIRTAALEFGTNDDPEVTVDIAPWPTEDVDGYIQIID